MIVDSHCHVHEPAFADVPAMVRAAHAAAVWGVVAVGCDAATNERTLAAARRAPRSVWPALGFHPEWHHLAEDDLEQVEAQVAAHHHLLVALGEIGLPWYSLETVEDAAGVMVRGRERLARLLDMAVRWDLAVVLHAPHGAAVGAYEALQRAGVERAAFHWHKAPPDVTRAIVDAGYYVSVTPEVVYRDRDRALVADVPLASLLVETDAPWRYGGEFESLGSGPWLASRVAEEIAKLKRLPAEDVAAELTANACRLFELPWM